MCHNISRANDHIPNHWWTHQSEVYHVETCLRAGLVANVWGVCGISYAIYEHELNWQLPNSQFTRSAYQLLTDCEPLKTLWRQMWPKPLLDDKFVAHPALPLARRKDGMIFNVSAIGWQQGRLRGSRTNHNMKVWQHHETALPSHGTSRTVIIYQTVAYIIGMPSNISGALCSQGNWYHWLLLPYR